MGRLRKREDWGRGQGDNTHGLVTAVGGHCASLEGEMALEGGAVRECFILDLVEERRTQVTEEQKPKEVQYRKL